MQRSSLRTPSLPVARRVIPALLLAGFSTLAVVAWLPLAAAATPATPAAQATPPANAWHFAFGAARDGYTTVQADMLYDAKRGFGFEPGADVRTNGFLMVVKPSYFTANLPEGTYNVTVRLGAPGTASNTTIKSELRRLMLENVSTANGAVVTRTFTVSVRTPRIKAVAGVAAGVVDLKAPRETVTEARIWDQALTLEINGTRPVIESIDIVPLAAPTIFLLGDSTVSDQPGEPYNSWGQMLPRFFKPGIAVTNLAQSGETYRDSLARRRLDKILSMMRPGDTVLMQYGHNDQKQIKDNQGGPFTTYKDEIRQHVAAIRQHGGIPVILSSMERRRFDDAGKPQQTLTDYATAARQSAQELGTAFIDLHTMSLALYQALGVEGSKGAFAEPQQGKLDNTHHNPYGSYELAQAVVTGLRQTGVPAAQWIADGYGNFDPAHPDPVAAFAVPVSPTFSNERPLGDEGNK
jgi:lysophospholipase L1-like esterase